MNDEIHCYALIVIGIRYNKSSIDHSFILIISKPRNEIWEDVGVLIAVATTGATIFLKTISDIRCHAAFNSRRIQSSLMYRSGERFVGILRSTSFQASAQSTIDCMGFGLPQQYDYNRQRASNQDCKFAISNDLHPTANILLVKSRWETSSVHATVPYGLAQKNKMLLRPLFEQG